MKRFIWLPLAGFLVIAGATVAAATPSIADTARAVLGSEAGLGTSTGDEGGGAGAQTHRARGGDHQSLLDEVLADLVADGTLTQAQADAVTSGVQAKLEEKRTEVEARRDEMKAKAEEIRTLWTQIKGFLEDDVITADELAQLPADNPLAKLSDEILADGQVTRDELRSVMPFGGRFGPGGRDGDHWRGAHGPRWPGPRGSDKPDTQAPDSDS